MKEQRPAHPFRGRAAAREASRIQRELLPEGTVLANRYLIERHVATGGMGAVYAARQRPFARLVALKVMHAELATTQELRARFFQEARAASLLSHPNTITVFDFGRSDDGRCFIAMEFVEGETLGQLIRDEGALPLSRAVPIVVQIAQSLGEAHSKHIIHRDLKPDNIMIRCSEEGAELIKVVDFGIAKLLQGSTISTQAGSVCGTPAYMAPEQGRGDPIDRRADLYSLGCCFFELLTGRPPFSGRTAIEVMLLHQNEPIPHLPPDLPREIDGFLQRALSKTPDGRPVDAAAFAAELLACFLRVSAPDLLPIPAPLSDDLLARAHTLALSPVNGPQVPASPPKPTLASAPPPPPPPTPERLPPRAPPPSLGARIFHGVSVAALLLGLGLTAAALLRPPPAAPVQAQLELDSLPQGALVYLGAEPIGVTPLTRALPAGDQALLRFEHPGYEPLQLAAFTAEPGTRSIFAPLTARQLHLHLQIGVPRAHVYVGELDLGVLPADRPRSLLLVWPAAPLELRIEAPGYLPLRYVLTPQMLEPEVHLRLNAPDFSPIPPLNPENDL